MTDTGKFSANPAGYVEVAREGQAILLRVVGLGNMNISLTMKDFVKRSIDEGFDHFALDLSRCQGMDSTFMGTIVGINYRVREKNAWFCLVNVNTDCEKLLKTLGVWGLVPVKEEFPVGDIETERLKQDYDEARRLKQIQTAHEHLVQIDARNKDRFGAFLSALCEEMKAIDVGRQIEEISRHKTAAPLPPATPIAPMAPVEPAAPVARRGRDAARLQRLRDFTIDRPAGDAEAAPK